MSLHFYFQISKVMLDTNANFLQSVNFKYQLLGIMTSMILGTKKTEMISTVPENTVMNKYFSKWAHVSFGSIITIDYIIIVKIGLSYFRKSYCLQERKYSHRLTSSADVVWKPILSWVPSYSKSRRGAPGGVSAKKSGRYTHTSSSLAHWFAPHSLCRNSTDATAIQMRLKSLRF